MSNFELYVHIPFCVRKCLYCDFCSGVYDTEIQKLYVDALCKEIKETAFRFSSKLSSIYIGGGTPSILPVNYLDRIASTIADSFKLANGVEISMEVNPGTVTKEKALAYYDIGINRISIGLQSANDAELSILGRIHNYRDFLESFDAVRKAGFKNVNVDLMYGLPGQGLSLIKNTLKEVIMLRPDHISAYSLIIEEGTPFFERYYDDAQNQALGKPTTFLPDEDHLVAMADCVEDVLSEARYEKYEVSNFAREGKQCRHNIGYWKRAAYLGVGLGAASLLKSNVYSLKDDTYLGSVGQVRQTNTKDMKKYLSGDRVAEHRVLTMDDTMSEFMFLGLRMTEGISKNEFYNEFGMSVDAAYPRQIKMLKENGLIIEEDKHYRLSRYGMDVSNIVLAEFV